MPIFERTNRADADLRPGQLAGFDSAGNLTDRLTDPIETSRRNLRSSRRNGQKQESKKVATARVDRIAGGTIWVSVGGGGEYRLKPFSNGSLVEGQIITVQITEGFGASATWMPQG